ncbi:hypothetical protein GO755_40455 [Spirosoma sp. HMF4905]|uniref:Phage integrase SAM-like domain-containing protein n=1 Tax=Spirosoma arboris TaxID=2682092 RepID=A0A7K1SRA0_9BACT|nr:phage integrase SAM-like domain-containing protein [Spirosoma arboris]MVM36345.1 hypothetical protein [Spirosoma arboris]
MQNIRFDIRKAQQTKQFMTGSADAKPTYDSLIEVSFCINSVRYGRYATGIRTFRSIWEGRKSVRVSAESKALINQLAAYEHLLESIHADLLSKGEAITGDLLIKIARNEELGGLATLASVFAEFMTARKAMIEPNRRLRKTDQIAEQTYKSYTKRWAMIELYLKHDKRNTFPIGAINYGFTTRLKEFLVAYQPKEKKLYGSATINKAISFLKMLVTYAQSKGYVEANVITSFACRGGSAANPKPLSEETLDYLENCPLPDRLRLICDSWLIAGELCLHYSDYRSLPTMRFVSYQGGTYIQNERSKQQGTSLVQTVNVTARAIRLLAKHGGPRGLYYKTSGAFSSALKQIAYLTNLRDREGNFIDLQFGQGRDTGLTSRARQGANAIQLSSRAGWSNPREARRYLGDALGIVAGFVERSGSGHETPTSPIPFSHIYKAS